MKRLNEWFELIKKSNIIIVLLGILYSRTCENLTSNGTLSKAAVSSMNNVLLSVVILYFLVDFLRKKRKFSLSAFSIIHVLCIIIICTAGLVLFVLNLQLEGNLSPELFGVFFSTLFTTVLLILLFITYRVYKHN